MTIPVYKQNQKILVHCTFKFNIFVNMTISIKYAFKPKKFTQKDEFSFHYHNFFI